MKNDETRPLAADRETEGPVPVQGTIESVGIREVLRLAGAHAPALLVLHGDGGITVELWWSPEGLGTLEPATAPEEVLAEALTLKAGRFEVTPQAVPQTQPPFEAVPFDDALVTAEALAPLWIDVVAVVPDRRSSVHLRRHVHAPVDVTPTQWRVLSRIGTGRGLGDLSALLRCSERASQRVVAELVTAGLVEVVAPRHTLTAPPTGPALAPPSTSPPLPPPAFEAPAFDAPAFDAPAVAAPTFAASASDASVVDVPAVGATVVDAPSAADDADWPGAHDTVPPHVDDSWSDEPVAPAVAPTAGWVWDDTDAVATEVAPSVADAWGAVATVSDDAIEWDPLPAGAPAPPVAPAAGFIEDPVGPHDEVLGSTDEELVNRALLFKFLSSVRD